MVRKMLDENVVEKDVSWSMRNSMLGWKDL
jgi:hypothetical protein